MYDEGQNKVLIVEDDENLRRTLRDGLILNYSIVEAQDGEIAIEKILAHKPRVVILDLLLPKVDGFEVLKRIRSYPDEAISKIPVLVFSNLSSNKDILSVQALQVEGYFVKATTDLEEVYKRVGEIIKNKKV